MSFIGSKLRTVGITSKLCLGGGDVVNHSSVFARHGSGPAGRPLRMLTIALYTVISTPSARMNEPIVEARLYPWREPVAWYSNTRRGMPDIPAECCGRNVRLKPITITQNDSFPRPSDMSRPVIFGNQ